MRLLLMISDPHFRQCLQTDLSELGYVVDCLSDDQRLLRAIETERFNALVLNDFCWQRELNLVQELRFAKNKVPTFLLADALTSRSRLQRFNAGADDVIAKPVTANELAVRFNCVLRRGSEQRGGVLHCRNLTLNPNTHQVTLDGTLVALPPYEFALLHQLLAHQGQVLSTEQLMQTSYGWEKTINSHPLAVRIHQLRKKLGRHLIETVTRVGYVIRKEDTDRGYQDC